MSCFITWKQARNINAIAGGPFRCEVREDMHNAEYRSSNGLNPSSIVYGRESMRKLRERYESDSEPTRQQLAGTYGHSLLLEPETLEKTTAIWGGKVRSGKAWNEFKEEHAGKLIVNSKDVKNIALGVSAALHDPEVKELLAEGVSEVAVYTEEAGLQCKGRLDRISTDTGTLIDVKFTGRIDNRAFNNTSHSFGYLMKTALYWHWFQRETSKRLERCCLLIIQDSPPHDHVISWLSQEDLDHAYKQALGIIGEVADCIEKDEWPGVKAKGPFVVSTPYWEMEELPELEGAEVCEH